MSFRNLESTSRFYDIIKSIINMMQQLQPRKTQHETINPHLHNFHLL